MISKEEIFNRYDTPQKNCDFLALIGTGIFWFVLLIVLIVAKPIVKKPEYKTVQIVLSSEPKKTVEKSTAQSAPSAPAAKKVTEEQKVSPAPKAVEEKPQQSQTAKVEQKVTQTQKKSEAPKTTASQPKAQTKPAESKPVQKQTVAKAPEKPVEYAKSVEDLMNEQFENKKTQEKKVDWSAMFDDDVLPEDNSDSSVQKINNKDAKSFSGTAASAAETPGGIKTSTSNAKSGINEKASDSTMSALGKIANTRFIGKIGSSVSSETTVKAYNGNGKNYIEMVNSNARALLEPTEPVINISEENAKSIDSTKTVEISFKVFKLGNVGDVKITPESVLTANVREEIINQIKKWRFEQADNDSIAKFKYTIIRK